MPKPKSAAARQENSRAELTPMPPQKLAMSIPEFCQAHGFSTALFFKLKRKGLTPRTMKVGTRTLISLEAAAAWREGRESASNYFSG